MRRLLRATTMQLIIACGLAASLLPAAAGSAAAADGGSPPAAGTQPTPLAVHSSSLTQDGQQVVWKVQLASAFSVAGLQHDHRALCLVLERAREGTVAGVACLQPRKRGSGMALTYARVTSAGRGPAHVINASLTRGGRSELTARFLPAAVDVAYAPLRWQVLSSLRSTGCADTTATAGCALWFPGRPRLARLHVPLPVGCVPSGRPYVTNGSRARHVVALTFDDGPWPDTPRFLDILEREHVHATFFQIGEQVSSYGRAVDHRMLADGDIIGDHTWNHANVSAGGSFAAGEISSTRSAIARLTGFSPCLFRAPGGAVSASLIGLARSMRFITIEWDVDTRDWARPGTGAILSTVLGNARNGSIILQHDGGGDRSETLAALPSEIRTLRARGYGFVTIPQLLGLRVIYR